MFVNIIKHVKVHVFMIVWKWHHPLVLTALPEFSKLNGRVNDPGPDIYLTSAALSWFIRQSLENMTGLVMYLSSFNENKSFGGTPHWRSMQLKMSG